MIAVTFKDHVQRKNVRTSYYRESSIMSSPNILNVSASTYHLSIFLFVTFLIIYHDRIVALSKHTHGTCRILQIEGVIDTVLWGWGMTHT